MGGYGSARSRGQPTVESASHQRTAQRKKVRVGDELGSEQNRTFSAIRAGINYLIEIDSIGSRSGAR
jgi:hypothetical protein